MKRYHFALDAVLRVRRAQEEAAGFALAHANQQRQRAEEAHRAALARCDELVMNRQPQDRDAFNRERDLTERRAAAVTVAVAGCEFASAVAAARLADWSEAAKLVAAVERLDERRREEWRIEVQRAEMAAIDESALAGWRADTAAASMRSHVGVSA